MHPLHLWQAPLWIFRLFFFKVQKVVPQFQNNLLNLSSVTKLVLFIKVIKGKPTKYSKETSMPNFSNETKIKIKNFFYAQFFNLNDKHVGYSYGGSLLDFLWFRTIWNLNNCLFGIQLNPDFECSVFRTQCTKLFWLPKSIYHTIH